MIQIGKAARILGVTPQTVRAYVRAGKLRATVNGSGRFLFDEQDCYDYTGRSKAECEHRVVFYVRSSNGQEASMRSQVDLLTARYGAPFKVYRDASSGLNENRRGLAALIRDITDDDISTVCVTHKDRLTRFGFHYLELLFKEHGTTVSVLSSSSKSLQEELMQDFMSLIASFSGRFYRMRGYEQQERLLHDAENVIEERRHDK
jgi:putative resolvase